MSSTAWIGALLRGTLLPMSDLIAAQDTAKRARAAMHYAGLTVPGMAVATGIDKATIRRIVAKTNPRAADSDERKKIAEACDVPLQFMEEGFALYKKQQTFEERLTTVEEALHDLTAQAAGQDQPSEPSDEESGPKDSDPEDEQPPAEEQ